MIKLTRGDDAPIWLNPSHVVSVSPEGETGSAVEYTSHVSSDAITLYVRETPEKVVRMIFLYNTAVADYECGESRGMKDSAVLRLGLLAGVGESDAN